MTENSEEKITALQNTIVELENATKLLVRRDLEFKRNQRELEALDERKSEFVSIAAHQLRTPLSALRWALQMVLDGEVGPLQDGQIVILQQAQQSITKMVSLVNDLLNADHLEYDKIAYEKQSVKIDKLIVDMIAELKPMADERFISITVDLDARGETIYCDPVRIKEAFLNLLNNAIKYSYPDSTIEIQTKKIAENVVISFTDTGIGIPDKYQTHIFQKFMRADNAKRVDADGSGLGMFIAHKIITAHGGTISFTSIEGKGTRFVVKLATG